MARYRFDQRILRCRNGKRTIIASFSNASPVHVYDQLLLIASESKLPNDWLEIEYLHIYPDSYDPDDMYTHDREWCSISDLGEPSYVIANEVEDDDYGYGSRTSFKEKLRNGEMRLGNAASKAAHHDRNAHLAAEASARRAQKRAAGLVRHAANIQASKDAAAARRAGQNNGAATPTTSHGTPKVVELPMTPSVKTLKRASIAAAKKEQPIPTKPARKARATAKEMAMRKQLQAFFPTARYETYTEDNIAPTAIKIKEGVFHYHREGGDEWDAFAGAAFKLTGSLRIVLLTTPKDPETVMLILHNIRTGEQIVGHGLCIWDEAKRCATTDWDYQYGVRNRYTFIGGKLPWAPVTLAA